MLMELCPYCEKGRIEEKIERNHAVMLAGRQIVMPKAKVGRCVQCGQVAWAWKVNDDDETKGEGNETKPEQSETNRSETE